MFIYRGNTTFSNVYSQRYHRKRISLEPQFEVVGEEATGRVDYAIKKIIDSLNEELICITKGKQNQEVLGIMQNIMQLESSTTQIRENERRLKLSMMILTTSTGSLQR